jgi:hypothetical protein
MGELVYLKSTATPSHLQEKWRGPFKVILTTPMAAKLAGFPSWVRSKSKTGSSTKDLPISSYRTNKNKDLLTPQDPRRWRHTHGHSRGIGRSPMPRTWHLTYSLFILSLSYSFLSVPAHTFTLSYIHSTLKFYSSHLPTQSASLLYHTFFTPAS